MYQINRVIVISKNLNRDSVSSVASLTIKSRHANIFVFVDCENNQFLKK